MEDSEIYKLQDQYYRLQAPIIQHVETEIGGGTTYSNNILNMVKNSGDAVHEEWLKKNEKLLKDNPVFQYNKKTYKEYTDQRIEILHYLYIHTTPGTWQREWTDRRLVIEVIFFVVFVLSQKNWTTGNLNDEDMISSVCLSIFREFPKYDPDRNKNNGKYKNRNFANWVYLCVMNQGVITYHELYYNNSSPTNAKKGSKIFGAIDRLNKKGIAEPNSEQISAECNGDISPYQIEKFFQEQQIASMVSLDEKRVLGMRAAELPEDVVLQEEKGDVTRKAIEKLSPEEQLVIKLKFSIPVEGYEIIHKIKPYEKKEKTPTNAEISEATGLSTQKVSSLLESAIKKLSRNREVAEYLGIVKSKQKEGITRTKSYRSFFEEMDNTNKVAIAKKMEHRKRAEDWLYGLTESKLSVPDSKDDFSYEDKHRHTEESNDTTDKDNDNK